MTERQHDRQKAEELVVAMSGILNYVTLNMRYLARSSSIDDANLHFPEEMPLLRETVEAAEGLPIQGELYINSYYVAAEEVYKRDVMPPRKNSPYDFQGVIRAVGEEPTPTIWEGKSMNKLCIAVDPLSTLRDANLYKYYDARGWHAQFAHPFAREEYRDTRIYIPVDCLGERRVRLLDYWKTT